MAIVLPLLVLLVFGIVEFGLAFNKRLTIGNATQSAARVGTAVANNEFADISTLEALEQGLIALPSQGARDHQERPHLQGERTRRTCEWLPFVNLQRLHVLLRSLRLQLDTMP